MISIIIGSTRKKSQSQKVATHIKEVIQSKTHLSVSSIDLSELSLPIWSDEETDQSSSWISVSTQLNHSTAFIFVFPEWDGMAAPAIKNFFSYCRKKELFHKPALLVSVSAGLGGSYPIAELRMSSYKNTRICYLPEHLIIRNCNNVLNSLKPENKEDEVLQNRIHYAISILTAYEFAFNLIRQNQFMQNTNYQNGM